MGRVLVVDDDEMVRCLVQAHLTQAGHRVLISSSADEAVAAIVEKGAPDVAVLDIRLPDMHGFDLARKLREIPAASSCRSSSSAPTSTNSTSGRDVTSVPLI